MSGLPENVGEAWWGARRAVRIDHALDALLEQIEQGVGRASCAPDPPDDLLPLSTGFLPLDRVLGGGVWRGTVTLVEAGIEAQGVALLHTVALRTPRRCLVDGPHFFETVEGLLAASAGVPRVSIAEGRMSEREWAALASGLRELGDREVRVSSTGSLVALAHVATPIGADLVVVHDPGRFGPPVEVMPALVKLAASAGAAVITSTAPIGDLPGWASADLTRLEVHGYGLGGRASLVRPDTEDLLAVAQVEVECLSGVVRPRDA